MRPSVRHRDFIRFGRWRRVRPRVLWLRHTRGRHRGWSMGTDEAARALEPAAGARNQPERITSNPVVRAAMNLAGSPVSVTSPEGRAPLALACLATDLVFR